MIQKIAGLFKKREKKNRRNPSATANPAAAPVRIMVEWRGGYSHSYKTAPLFRGYP